ncbi:MAG: DNA methyltransferase, partial [Chloroflexota bacterium]
MEPLRRRWAQVQEQTAPIVESLRQAEAAPLGDRQEEARRSRRLRAGRQALLDLLTAFQEEVAGTRVLDPACGSGNFLYVALKRLLDLEKEVVTFGAANGVGNLFPRVGPEQLFGVEINAYAHELASVVVWIGYIQWLRDNGFGSPAEPILKPLANIQHMDAILAGENGKLVEPEWPEADIIIGNPPFLGGKLLRRLLGDKYVDDLFRVYDGRVPREADLVTYWFERARAHIESGRVKRAGLLATQGIRGGANRRVLERIKVTGDIFMAWSDRKWILDGAAVRISMVGFDDGEEQSRTLDGAPVEAINPNLTGALDLTTARRLRENLGLSF